MGQGPDEGSAGGASGAVAPGPGAGAAHSGELIDGPIAPARRPAYLMALVLVGVDIAVRLALAHWLNLPLPFLLLYPLAVLAAVRLGLGPALVVVLAGCVGVVLVPTSIPAPAATLSFATAMSTFAITSGAVAMAVDRMRNAHRAESAAVRAAAELSKAEALAAAAQVEAMTASKALAVHRATYDALTTTLPVAVWVAHDPSCSSVTGNAESDRLMRRLPENGEARPSVTARFYKGGNELQECDLPLCRAARDGVEVRNEDMDLLFSDGVRRLVRFAASPILDDVGARRGGVSVGVDITDRRQAENAVQESESRFRVMADHAPVLIWMADTTKQCTWFSKLWLEFRGRTMEQELGFGWMEGIHPDDLERSNRSYDEHFARREPFKVKYRLRRGHGQWRWIMDQGVPMFTGGAGGAFTGYIGSCLDITELEEGRKGAEEHAGKLERLNHELEDFAHIAAHDLKEPLRGVRLVASFLEEDFAEKLGPEGRARIAKLQDLCNRSQLLLDSLMGAAIVARDTPDLQPNSLGEMVSEAKALLAGRLRESGAEVAVEDGTGGTVLRCDRKRTVQLLMNLISNGIKYNDSEAKRVSVGVQPQADTPGGPPVVFVRDNGIGIPPDRQSEVFRIFRRLHTRDAYGGGAGAGLAIAKKIVERQGGRIWLSSQPGEGTTFYFMLAG